MSAKVHRLSHAEWNPLRNRTFRSVNNSWANVLPGTLTPGEISGLPCVSQSRKSIASVLKIEQDCKWMKCSYASQTGCGVHQCIRTAAFQLTVFSENYFPRAVYLIWMQARKFAVGSLLFDESRRQSRNLFWALVGASSYNWMKKITWLRSNGEPFHVVQEMLTIFRRSPMC